MGTIDRPETLVRNYHYWLRNNTEGRSSVRPDFRCLICCYSCLSQGNHKLKPLNYLLWTVGVTASMPMRSSPFWDVTRHRLVVTDVLEHPNGLIFKASWAALPLNRRPIVCPKHRYGITTLHCVTSHMSADVIYSGADALSPVSAFVCPLAFLDLCSQCERHSR